MLGGGAKDAPEMPIRAHARDVFAGLVASVVTIAYGLSFAALIFAPPLTAWLAYGIAATFITSADHRRLRRRAQFAALRHCRTRSHDCRGHGDARKRARGAASRQGRIRRSPCAGRRHHGPFRGLHRHLVVRPRACARRRRHPLHSLSRHWRFSRSNRLPDGERRRARHHRPPDRTLDHSPSCSRPSDW